MAKPVFYKFKCSTWSAVPELALIELGYEEDEIDKVELDLLHGENFQSSFLRINPKGTIPTLTARGKVYASTAEVTRYLIEHDVRGAPGKLSTTNLVATLHGEALDPNLAMLSARDEEELVEKSKGIPLAFLRGRQATLNNLLSSPSTDEFTEFLQIKSAVNDGVLAIYEGRTPAGSAEAFFAMSTKHWENIRKFVVHDLPKVLPDEGFIGGQEPGEDDFHLVGWLARIIGVIGGADACPNVLKPEFKQDVPEKLLKYWRLWSSRESYKVIYADGLLRVRL